jgi:hypothetical protein
MAKKKVVEETPQEKSLAVEMAKYSRIPCMKKEEFEKMVEALKPLGVKFELKPVRGNAYKGGKEPFAYKVTTQSFTFVVDLL